MQSAQPSPRPGCDEGNGRGVVNGRGREGVQAGEVGEDAGEGRAEDLRRMRDPRAPTGGQQERRQRGTPCHALTGRDAYRELGELAISTETGKLARQH